MSWTNKNTHFQLDTHNVKVEMAGIQKILMASQDTQVRIIVT